MTGNTVINIELTPELYSNLRALVMAGAKSPQTDDAAIHAASQLLLLMEQQRQAQSKPNGHAAEAAAAQPAE